MVQHNYLQLTGMQDLLRYTSILLSIFIIFNTNMIDKYSIDGKIAKVDLFYNFGGFL